MSGLALNVAPTFTTNTNWQSYVHETTMSYLTQMAGLSYQNFVSAAAGIAVAIAVIRRIAGREQDTIGNFWVDFTRAWTRVLLPASFGAALVLVSQGVVQKLRPYDRVPLLNPFAVTVTDVRGGGTTIVVREQLIAQGPVASQEAIKELGTSGGGFFSTNSAHPFENPTPLTNLLQMLLIFAIPAGLTFNAGYAVVGLTERLTESAGRESDGKPVHPHAEEFCSEKVS